MGVKRKNKNYISSILLILFFVIFIFSSIKVAKWLKENKDRNDLINELQETITIDNEKDDIERFSVDFNGLKEKNPDTIAWIKVNGTNIEYPVVKTNDNDFYLNHSFDKSYNSGGWVFMDYKNIGDGSDKNVVIYGHNRRDGGIFGTLKNILTKEWQNNDENNIISFISENKKEEYHVFSVYKIEKEDYYITTSFNTDTEFNEYLDEIKTRSNKDFGVDVSTDDDILTLSTCANNNNYRVVLHAKKLINK